MDLNDVYLLRDEAKAAGEPILRDKSFELLLETIKRYKPKKILEIGTNVGLSGIAMLLTSSGASLTGIEIDEEKKRTAESNYIRFGVEKRAKIFLGDAGEILPVLTGEYDFVFLDGPKGHYYEYLSFIVPVLKSGGVIFADNVLFRGYVTGKVKMPHRFATTKHSMENFLESVKNSDMFETTVYDIEDGVSVTVKKVKPENERI